MSYEFSTPKYRVHPFMSDAVLVRFAGISLAKAGQYADTLRNSILDAAPNARVRLQKDLNETQDFGTTVGILLAAPSVVAIAKGVESWLERHHGVELEITSGDSKIVVKNVTARNILDVLELVTKSGRQK